MNMYFWTQQTNPLSTLTEVCSTEAAEFPEKKKKKTLELQNTHTIFVCSWKSAPGSDGGMFKIEGRKQQEKLERKQTHVIPASLVFKARVTAFPRVSFLQLDMV